MKKFIIKELRIVGNSQLDESIQGSMPSGFTYAIQNGFEKWAQTKDKGTLANVNNTSIELVANKFDGEFANYLRNTYFSAASDLILTKSNIVLNKENASCSFDIEFSSETSQYN
jgi:hypothetical protein